MPPKRQRGGKRRSSRHISPGWNCTTRAGERVTLTGHLIDFIEEDDRGDENDDGSNKEEEEEFEDCDMEDQNAILAGAADGRKRQCPTKKCHMEVKTCNGTSRVKVRGKFIFDGPWWCITCDAVKDRIRGVESYTIKSPCSAPTYSLRNEGDMKTLLTMLVSRVFSNPNAENAENQMKASFLDYLRSRNSLRSFAAFFEAVEAAKEQEDDLALRSLANFVMKRFLEVPRKDDDGSSSEKQKKKKKKKKQADDLRAIYRCFKYPELFRVLPRLVERRTFSILTTEDVTHLEVLDKVLRESPEDFGFETTMRKHGWRLVEADYQGFVDAGIIPRLSDRMLLALQYYNIVKDKCHQDGHTFVHHYSADHVYMKRNYGLQKPEEKERISALNELQKRNVIEVIGHKWHWVKYRNSERSIANALSRLVRYHQLQPYVIPDGDDSDCNFDPLQQKAATSIRKKPFSVILGKGGCGKTHVACSVLRQLPKRWTPENQADVEEKSDDEGKSMSKEKKGDKKEDPVEQPIVLLTAPTGRAASILARRTGMKAKTLHSVTSSRMPR
ncbi:DNA helicase B-like [Diadema antillarum]|uniref:DNA helicase B-like n=1 Tax=Diadema antillarum TaxID=105358 RepID=UPI003A83E125